MLVNLKNPQQTGKNSFKVYISLETNTEYDDAGNVIEKTYTVKGIDVSTSDYETTYDAEYIFSTEP